MLCAVKVMIRFFYRFMIKEYCCRSDSTAQIIYIRGKAC